MELQDTKALGEEREPEMQLLRNTIAEQKLEAQTLCAKIAVLEEENQISRNAVESLTNQLSPQLLEQLKESPMNSVAEHVTAAGNSLDQTFQLKKDTDVGDVGAEQKVIDISSLEEQVVVAQTKQREAEELVELKDSRIIELEAQLLNIKKQVLQFDNERGQLRGQMEKVNQEIRGIVGLGSNLQYVLSSEKTEENESMDRLELNDEVADIVKQMEIIKREYFMVTQKLQAEKTKTTELMEQREDDEEKAHNLADDMKSLELELQLAQSHLVEAKKTIDQYKQDKQTLYKDVEELCCKLATKDDMITEMGVQSGDILDKLCEDHVIQKTKLTERLEIAEQNLATNLLDLADVRSKLSRKEEELEALYQTNKEIQQDTQIKHQLENRIKELVSELQELNKTVQSLQAENSRLIQDNNDSKVALERAEASKLILNKKMHDQWEEMSSEVLRLTQELTEQMRRRDTEKEELQDQVHRVLVAQTKQREAEELVELKDSRIKELETQLLNIKKQVLQLDNERGQLRGQMEKMNQEMRGIVGLGSNLQYVLSSENTEENESVDRLELNDEVVDIVKQMEIIKREYFMVTQKLQAEKTKTTELMKQCQDDEEKAHNLADDIKSLELELQLAQSQLVEAKKTIDEYKQDKQTLNKDVEELCCKLATKDDMITEMGVQSSDILDKLCKDHVIQKTKLTERLEIAEQNLATNLLDLADVRSKLSRKEEELEALYQTNKEIQQDTQIKHQLEIRIKELVSELQELNKTVQSLQAENSRLIQDNNDSKVALERAEASKQILNKKMHDQWEEMSSEVLRLTQELTEQMRRRDTEKEELQDQVHRVLVAQTKQREAEELVELKDSRIKELETQLLNIKKQVLQLDNERGQLRGQMEKMNQEMRGIVGLGSNLQYVLSSENTEENESVDRLKLNDEVADIVKQMEIIKREYFMVTQKLQAEKTKTTEIMKQCQDDEEKAHNLADDIKSLELELQLAQSQLAEAKKTIDEYKQDKQTLNKDVEELCCKLATKDDMITEMGVQSSDILDKLCKDHVIQKTKLTERLEIAEQNLATNLLDLADVRSKLSRKEEELEALYQTNKEIQQDTQIKHQLENRIKELVSELQELNKTVQSLQAENSRLIQDNNDSKVALEKAEASKQILNKKMHDQWEEMSSEVLRLTQELTEQMRRRDAEKEELQDQVQRVAANLKVADVSLSAVSETKDSLYQSNQSFQNTVNTLRLQLQEENSYRKLAEQKLETMTCQMRDVINENDRQTQAKQRETEGLLDQKNNKIHELETELSKLKEQSMQQENDVYQVRAQMEIMNQEISSMMTLSNKPIDISSCRCTTEEERRVRQELREQVADTVKQIAIIKQDYFMVNQSLQTERNKTADLTEKTHVDEKKAYNLAHRIKTLELELQAAESRLVETRDTIDKYKQDKQTLYQEIEQLCSQIARKDEIVVELQAQSGDVINKLRETQVEQNNALTEKHERMEQELTTTKINLEDAQKMLQRKELELEALHQNNKELERNSQLKQERESQIRELESDLQQLKVSVQHLKTENARLIEDNKDSTAALERGEESNQTLREQMHRERDDLSSEIRRLMQQLSAEMRKYDKERGELQYQLNKANSNLKTTKVSLSEVSTSKDSLQESNQNLQDTVDTLKAQLHVEKTNRQLAENLTSQLREAHNENDRRTQENQCETEKLLEGKKNRIQELETELLNIKKQLIQRDTEICQMRGHMERLNQDIRSIVGTHQDMSTDENTAGIESSLPSGEMHVEVADAVRQMDVIKREYFMVNQSLQAEKTKTSQLLEQNEADKEKACNLADDIKTLELELLATQSHLAEAKETIEQYKQEKQTLYQDVEELCSKLAKKDEIVTELQAQSGDILNKMRDEQIEQKTMLTERLQRAEHNLGTTQVELDDARDMLRRKELQLESLYQHNKELQQDIRLQQAREYQIKGLESELHQLTVSVQSLQAENARLIQENNDSKDALQKGEASNQVLKEQMRSQYDEMTSEIERLTQQLSEETGRHDDEKAQLQDQLNNANENLKDVEVLLSTVYETKLSLHQSNQSFHDTVEELRTHLVDEIKCRELADQRVETLTLHLQEVSIENEKQLEEKQREWKELLDQKDNNIRELETDLRNNNKQVLELENERGQIRNHMGRICQEIRSMVGHSSNLQDMRGYGNISGKEPLNRLELNEEVAEAARQMEIINREYFMMSQTLQSERNKTTALLDQFQCQDESTSSLTDAIKTMKTELQAAQSRLEDTKLTVEQYRRDKQSLNQEVEELYITLTKKEEAVNEIQIQTEEALNMMRDQHANEKNVFTEKLQNAENSLSTMQVDMAIATEELQRKEQQLEALYKNNIEIQQNNQCREEVQSIFREYEAEIHRLKCSLQEMKAENITLVQDNQETKEALSTAKVAKEELSDQMVSFQKEMSAELVRLTDQMVEETRRRDVENGLLQDKLNTLNDDLKVADVTLCSVTEAKKSLQQSNQSLQDTIHKVKTQLQEETTCLKLADQKVESMASQLRDSTIKQIQFSQEKQRQYNEMLEQKDNSIHELHDEMQRLKTELMQLETERGQIQGHIERMNQEIRSTKGETCQAKSSGLETEVVEAVRQVEMVKQEYITMSHSLEAEKAKTAELEEQCEVNVEKASKLTDRVTTLELELQTVQSHLAEAKDTIEQYKLEKQASYQDIEELRAKLAGKDETVIEVQAQCGEAVNKLREEHIEQKTMFTERLQKAEHDLATTRVELEDARERVRRKELQLELLYQNNRELQKDAKLKVELTSQMKGLESELQQLRDSVQTLETANNNLIQDNKDSKEALEKAETSRYRLSEQLRTQYNDMSSEILHLTTKLSEETQKGNAEKCELQDQLNKANDKLKSTELSLSTLSETKDKLLLDNQGFQDRVDTLRSRLHEEITSRKLAEQKMETLTSQLQDFASKNAEYDERNADQKSQIVKLKTELIAERGKYKKLRRDLSESKNNTQTLDAHSQFLQMQVAELQEEVSSLRNQLNTYKQDQTGKNKRLLNDLKRQAETFEEERNKLAAHAQQLSVDLEQTREMLALKNQENVKLQEDVLIIENQLRERELQTKASQDALKVETDERIMLGKRNTELSLLLEKMRPKDENDKLENTRIDAQKMLSAWTKKMQDQINKQKGSESEAKARDQKRISEYKKKIDHLEALLSQEQVMHIVTKTRLASVEDDNQRLHQHLKSLRKRFSSCETERPKNRMEEINEIITKSQTRAHQLVHSGPYRDDPLQTLSPSRDFQTSTPLFTSPTSVGSLKDGRLLSDIEDSTISTSPRCKTPL